MANSPSSTSVALRIFAGAGLGLSLIGNALAARAANLCPWINEATASGLLGANATGSYVEASAGKPAECSFVANDPQGTRTLTVDVEVLPDASRQISESLRACAGEASKVEAIGNEASACSTGSRKAPPGELLVGRVRDQLFTIAISTTRKNDTVISPASLRSKIVTAAEQVSGNLF